MLKTWFKLYGSGDTCGLYLDDKIHTVDSHLLGREAREKIACKGSIQHDWPELHVHGSVGRFFKRRFDVVAPQFTSGCPAFTERAMTLLRRHWKDDVEWLPTKHRGGLAFFIAHPLRNLDAQHREKSKITYVPGYPEEPRYITSLHDDWIYEAPELKTVQVFCTPESAGRALYVSDETKLFFNQNKITGAAFEAIGVTPQPTPGPARKES